MKRMKRLFKALTLLLCALMLICPRSSFASSQAYASNGFVYTVGFGQAEIVGYTGNDENLIVPPQLSGFPVSAIGSMAFAFCDQLRSVALPSSLVYVGEGAFARCAALEKVEFVPGVTQMGQDVFTMCVSLREVTLPSTLKSISKGMFSGCESLEKIDLPAALESIEPYAFANCVSLASLSLPSGVHSVSDQALVNCRSLSLIKLSSLQVNNVNICLPNWITLRIAIPDLQTPMASTAAPLSSSALATPNPYIGHFCHINVDGGRVRSGPGMQYSQVDTVDSTETYQIHDAALSSDGIWWFKIYTMNHSGWISSNIAVLLH